MALKTYQVLTQESIEKIESVIAILQKTETILSVSLKQEIEDLKAILTDVKE